MEVVIYGVQSLSMIYNNPQSVSVFSLFLSILTIATLYLFWEA